MAFDYKYKIELSDYFIIVIRDNTAYRSRSLFIKEDDNTFVLISDLSFSIILKNNENVRFQVRKKYPEVNWSDICIDTTQG